MSRRNRYAGMKRYFDWHCTVDYKNREDAENLMKPKKIGEYNAFVDGYTIVMTKEDIGEIEYYNGDENKFFDVENFNISTSIAFFNSRGTKKIKTNFKKMFKWAKDYGYTNHGMNKKGDEPRLLYKNHVFKICLIDKVVSILDDGNDFTITIDEDREFSPMRIESSIGYGYVLPMRTTKYEKKLNKDNYYNKDEEFFYKEVV